MGAPSRPPLPPQARVPRISVRDSRIWIYVYTWVRRRPILVDYGIQSLFPTGAWDGKRLSYYIPKVFENFHDLLCKRVSASVNLYEE